MNKISDHDAEKMVQNVVKKSNRRLSAEERRTMKQKFLANMHKMQQQNEETRKQAIGKAYIQGMKAAASNRTRSKRILRGERGLLRKIAVAGGRKKEVMAAISRGALKSEDVNEAYRSLAEALISQIVTGETSLEDAAEAINNGDIEEMTNSTALAGAAGIAGLAGAGYMARRLYKKRKRKKEMREKMARLRAMQKRYNTQTPEV